MTGVQTCALPICSARVSQRIQVSERTWTSRLIWTSRPIWESWPVRASFRIVVNGRKVTLGTWYRRGSTTVESTGGREAGYS